MGDDSGMPSVNSVTWDNAEKGIDDLKIAGSWAHCQPAMECSLPWLSAAGEAYLPS